MWFFFGEQLLSLQCFPNKYYYQLPITSWPTGRPKGTAVCVFSRKSVGGCVIHSRFCRLRDNCIPPNVPPTEFLCKDSSDVDHPALLDP